MAEIIRQNYCCCYNRPGKAASTGLIGPGLQQIVCKSQAKHIQIFRIMIKIPIIIKPFSNCIVRPRCGTKHTIKTGLFRL